MNRYQVMLTSDLDETYQAIAEGLEMSVEQVLSSALQIYAEGLTLRPFDGVCDVGRVREFENLCKEDLRKEGLSR